MDKDIDKGSINIIDKDGKKKPFIDIGLTDELTDEEKEMFTAICSGGYDNGELCLMATNFNGVSTPTICIKIDQGDHKFALHPLYVMVAGRTELLKRLLCGNGQPATRTHEEDYNED